MRLRQLSSFAIVMFATSLCACGGGGVSTTPVALPVTAASLPAATASSCIAQQTAAQTAALPAAGGVSGTISIGATAASGACLAVTVATGANATLAAVRSAAATVRLGATATATAAPSPLPPALAQVSLTNTYTGNLTWVAMTLQLPTGTVPPGQYPATITSTNDLDGTVDTSVANFTVTITATGQAIVTGPSAQRFLAILAADTTGVLAIYPPGTVLPTISPLPLTTPSPAPSPSATPSPAASATIAPTLVPSPSPTIAATAAPFKIAVSPASCIDAGNTGPTLNYQAFPNVAAPAGTSYLFSWEAASIYASRWVVTVPVVTFNFAGSYGVLTTSDTASITVPIYATINDITGEGAGIRVSAFVYDPHAGSVSPVYAASGQRVYGGAPIAAGSVTCKGLGY